MEILSSSKYTRLIVLNIWYYQDIRKIFNKFNNKCSNRRNTKNTEPLPKLNESYKKECCNQIRVVYYCNSMFAPPPTSPKQKINDFFIAVG